MICAEALNTVVSKRINWLWQGRIAFGKVTLLQGDTGIGKTNLVVKLAADLSNGIHLPALVDSAVQEPIKGELLKTFYVTIENDLADTIAPLFDRFGGNREYMYYQREDVGHFVLNEKDIADCVRETGAKLIIVDPWQEFLDRGISETYGGVRQMINRIQLVASQFGVAVVLAGNFVKAGSSDITRQRGSSELANTLRTMLTLKNDPKGDKRVRILDPTKVSLFGAEKNPVVIRMDDDYKMSFQSYDEYMGEPCNEEKDTPAGFLMDILSGGAFEQSEDYAAGKRTGLQLKYDLSGAKENGNTDD